MNKINISALRAIITFACVFVIIMVTQAQNKTYTLSGQVITGNDSVAVKGVIVQIPGTKFRDTTNADGFYRITNIPAGTNTVTATTDHFEKWSNKVLIKSNTKLVIRIIGAAHDDVPQHPTVNQVIPPPDSASQAKKTEEPKKKKDKTEDPKDDKKKSDDKKKDDEKDLKKEVNKKQSDSSLKTAQVKEKKKKKTKEELKADEFARKDLYMKEIEDVVAFENLYFSDFILKKNHLVTAIGYFSVENKQIYLFTAIFKWTGETCTMENILVELKGTK